MNNERRKRIADLLAQLEEIHCGIVAIKDEEQAAFDNLPDSFQETSRGADMESAIEHLDTAESDLDEVIESLKSASA